MAKLKTQNIYVGDSFNVHYKCWKHRTVQNARTQFGGTEQNLARDPITPWSATVQLVNFETNTVIPLGPNGTREGTAIIEGNDVSFLIDSSKFTTEGSYRVYTRVTFEDSRKLTEVLQFRVQSIG